MNPFLAPALGLMLASLLPGEARAERTLTRDEAVRMALRRNEDVVIERESVAAALAGVRGARGAYDPVLEFSGGWSRSTEPVNSAFSGAPPGRFAPELESADAGGAIHQLLPTGGALSVRASGTRQTSDGLATLLSPAYGTSVGVELRQPLLRDLATDDARLRLRVAGAGRRAATAALERSVSTTVAAVERAYWNLVAVRQGVEVREDAVHLAEQQLSETETRVESGAAPGTEMSQPRAELERRRGELLGQREAEARAENALKLLILPGAEPADWLERFTPTDDATVTVTAVDVRATLERALARRPELDEAHAALDRRRAETARARSALWPSLDAVVSYDRFGLAGTATGAGPGEAIPPELDGGLGRSFGTIRDRDFDATRVGLVLGLPITNRTARSGLAIARSAERQAEALLAKARKAVCAEVLDAAAAVQAAGQRVQAARAGRQAAETQLAAERDRYASGLSTNFLVLTRQNDLARARLEEISARTDYETARTELSRAAGSLIEERGIDTLESTRNPGGIR